MAVSAVTRLVHPNQEEIEFGGITPHATSHGKQYWHWTESSTVDHTTAQELCQKWGNGEGNLAMLKNNDERQTALDLYLASGE